MFLRSAGSIGRNSDGTECIGLDSIDLDRLKLIGARCRCAPTHLMTLELILHESTFADFQNLFLHERRSEHPQIDEYH